MAKFYVNRGGGRVPEGPFEELQIVKLILAGKLRSGHVSEVGSQRFVPLASHPTFGRALGEAGVAVDPAAATRVTLNTKNTSRGLLLGAVLAIFGLALSAVAIGTYVMFQNGGMPIRGAVPTDTEVLVEIRSVPQLIADLRTVRMVDVPRYLNAAFFSDTAQAFTDSFGVPKAQTEALLLAASSLGVAGRKLATAPEGGFLLSFSGSAPVNAFLQSRRFTYTGLVAKNGRKYALAAGTAPPTANVDQTRRTLIALSLAPQTAVLVWFETSKVLFVGSPAFAESVAHVVSLDVPSLEQSPAFEASQREIPGKPNVTGYLDSVKLGGNNPVEALLGGHIDGASPVTASMDVLPAGLVTHFARHAQTPAGAPTNVGPTPSLSLVDRLPIETFAYVAGSTQTGNSGPELEERLLARLGTASPELEARARAELAQSEQLLSWKFADLLGSFGDQGAFGVVAPQGYSIALGEPLQMAAQFAVVYVQALKDEAPARAACKALQARLAALPIPISIEQTANGYRLKTADTALVADIRFEQGFLFIAVGGAPLVERSVRAFSNGERTLGTDAAHHTARAALPNTGELALWVDAGRVVDALQQNPILGVPAWHFGFEAILATHWTGPDRVTAAFVLSNERKAGITTYRMDALNLPIIAAFYGLRAMP